MFLDTPMYETGIRKKDGELGIEIEMEGKYLFEIDGWKKDYDHSLRGASCEWILRQPLDVEPAKEAVVNLYKTNLDRGAIFTPSLRCGVHIHLNITQWTVRQILLFSILYYSVEGLLTRWAQREGNPFALSIVDADDILEGLADSWIRQRLFLAKEGFKYSALNFSNVKLLGSIEARAMHTPVTPEPILTWIDILIKLRDKAFQYREPRDIIEELSVIYVNGFIHNIFEELAPLFLFKDRDALVWEAVRLIQWLCYVTIPEMEKESERPVEKKRIRKEVDDFFARANVQRNTDLMQRIRQVAERED